VSTKGDSSPLPEAIDPIFGLHYNVASTEFEVLPADVYSSCKGLTNEGWDRKMWIFAESGGSEPRYVVVGGFFVKRASSGRMPATTEIDKAGAVVRLMNGRCDMIGAARDVFDYPPPEMAASKLEELAKNAVCRYSRAFGSYHNFMELMHRRAATLNSLQQGALKSAVLSPPDGCQ
jgi:hypothetical protein